MPLNATQIALALYLNVALPCPIATVNALLPIMRGVGSEEGAGQVYAIESFTVYSQAVVLFIVHTLYVHFTLFIKAYGVV